MQNVNKRYVCNAVTGRIRLKVSGHGVDNVNEDEVVVKHEDVNLFEHYYDVVSQSIVSKKVFAEGQWNSDTYTVQLPEGTVVYWKGEKYEVQDGILELLVDQAGSHILTITHPHYITESRSIENPN